MIGLNVAKEILLRINNIVDSCNFSATNKLNNQAFKQLLVEGKKKLPEKRKINGSISYVLDDKKEGNYFQKGSDYTMYAFYRNGLPEGQAITILGKSNRIEVANYKEGRLSGKHLIFNSRGLLIALVFNDEGSHVDTRHFLFPRDDEKDFNAPIKVIRVLNFHQGKICYRLIRKEMKNYDDINKELAKHFSENKEVMKKLRNIFSF